MFLLWILNIFHIIFSVFIDDFEQVNVISDDNCTYQSYVLYTDWVETDNVNNSNNSKYRLVGEL